MKHSTQYIILTITIHIVEMIIILLSAVNSVPFAIMIYVVVVTLNERILKITSKKLEIQVWRQIK